MHISNGACWMGAVSARTEPQCDIGHTRGKKKWMGAVPEAVHLNNDQSEGAVRDMLQGHLSWLLFFSVQRLHGFRQVVTHVQSQQKDEL